jgi:predicted nucleotidyltransferase
MAIFQNMEAPPPTISPNTTEGLTTVAATALALFRDTARASYGDRLAKIVLFGSRARGEGRSDSDLDIAIVLRDLTDKGADRNRLADLAYDAIVETSMDIQAVPISLDEWDHPDHHSNPALIRAIKRDGKVVEVGNGGPEAKMAVVTISERKARGAALVRSAAARVMDELKTYAGAHGGRFLVFGSVATGKVKFDSDLDVVVDFPDGLENAAIEFVEDACAANSLPYDVYARTTSSEAFLARIMPQAVILK